MKSSVLVYCAENDKLLVKIFKLKFHVGEPTESTLAINESIADQIDEYDKKEFELITQIGRGDVNDRYNKMKHMCIS